MLRIQRTKRGRFARNEGDRMYIEQLEYFLAASRTLNYTQAAARMFTSRQNLSYAVKELEHELGASLFKREGNTLALTPEGEETASRVQGILSEIDKLKSAFVKPEGADEPLRILIGSNIFTFSPYDMPTILDALPGGSFRISELDCLECYEEVVASHADVAIVTCMDRDFPDCEAVMLHQKDIYLLIGEASPLAKKSELHISDIVGERLTVPPGYEFQLEPLVHMLKQYDASLSNVDVISGFSFVSRTARRCEGIGIASTAFWNFMPEGCTIRPFAEPSCRMGLFAVYRKSSPKADAIAKLVEQLSDLITSN